MGGGCAHRCGEALCPRGREPAVCAATSFVEADPRWGDVPAASGREGAGRAGGRERTSPTSSVEGKKSVVASKFANEADCARLGDAMPLR